MAGEIGKGFWRNERGTWDDPTFKNEKFTEREAWFWLKEHARYKSCKRPYHQNIVEIKVGQIGMTYRNLAKIWGWDPGRVGRYIEKLEMCTKINTSVELGFLVVTICGYEKISGRQDSTKSLKNTAPKTESEQEEPLYIVTKEEEGLKKGDPTQHNVTKKREVVFNQIYLLGCKLFPILQKKDYSVIHHWLDQGYDPELDILPAIIGAQGRDLESWKYFTQAITNNFEARY